MVDPSFGPLVFRSQKARMKAANVSSIAFFEESRSVSKLLEKSQLLGELATRAPTARAAADRLLPRKNRQSTTMIRRLSEERFR